VDSMNKAFGSVLRRELVKLIDSPVLLRHRAQSTGSQRLSSDSTEELNDIVSESFSDSIFAEGGYM
jgi:hypothetical protein